MTRLAAAALSTLALLAGCAVGPDYRAPNVDLPARYRADPGRPQASVAPAPSPWWRSFADPDLDALETAALAQNLDLAQALARRDQAQAVARIAGAALRPAGEAAAQASQVRESLESSRGIVVQAFPRLHRTGQVYAADVAASWDLDLFGGLGRRAEAARAELEAAGAGVAAARLIVSADVAEAYIRLRGAQQRLGVLDQRIAGLRDTDALVAWRVGQGAAAGRDEDAAAADLAEAQAARPALRAAIEAELDRLAVLSGRAPESDRGDLVRAAAVPRPAPGVAGAPADLLRRRPDLVVAERRLAAADAQIGAAIAEYYPKVSLQALLGVESLQAETLFTGRAVLAQSTAGLRWRLFDFGRISGEVALARGRRAEALAAYRQAVLRGAAEVEAALNVRLQTAEQAQRLAEATQDLLRRRAATADAYAAGAANLLELRDAERQLLLVEDRAIEAEVGQALAEVSLVRGTGGGLEPL